MIERLAYFEYAQAHVHTRSRARPVLKKNPDTLCFSSLYPLLAARHATARWLYLGWTTPALGWRSPAQSSRAPMNVALMNVCQSIYLALQEAYINGSTMVISQGDREMSTKINKTCAASSVETASEVDVWDGWLMI